MGRHSCDRCRDRRLSLLALQKRLDQNIACYSQSSPSLIPATLLCFGWISMVYRYPRVCMGTIELWRSLFSATRSYRSRTNTLVTWSVIHVNNSWNDWSPVWSHFLHFHGKVVEMAVFPEDFLASSETWASRYSSCGKNWTAWSWHVLHFWLVQKMSQLDKKMS